LSYNPDDYEWTYFDKYGWMFVSKEFVAEIDNFRAAVAKKSANWSMKLRNVLKLLGSINHKTGIETAHDIVVSVNKELEYLTKPEDVEIASVTEDLVLKAIRYELSKKNSEEAE